jgi:hypothetical protein
MFSTLSVEMWFMLEKWMTAAKRGLSKVQGAQSTPSSEKQDHAFLCTLGVVSI